MKIIFFASDNNKSSGAFRCLVKVASGVQAQGDEVLVVYPFWWTGNRMVRQAHLKRRMILSITWTVPNGLQVLYFFLHILFWPFWLVSYLRTRFLFEKFKPDLVVINTLYTSLGAYVAKQMGIPVVWHIREFLEEAQHRHFFSKKKAQELMSYSSKIITVSKGLYLKYKDTFKPDQLTYIYDGVPQDQFYAPEHELFKDQTVHIVAVGRVQDYKGQYLMLQALNELSDYDFDVTLVGVIHPDYRMKLEPMMDKIKERVKFVGEQSDPAPYYKAADIFSMNSKAEAFGLVTAEGMLSGDLVIGNNEMGTGEILESEQYGLLYKTGDVSELKNKFIYAFTHKDEMKRIAKAGQERALNKFTIRKNVANLYEEYRKAAKKD
jgi:glycosyltransferase involved in cell wall biosynthesis